MDLSLLADKEKKKRNLLEEHKSQMYMRTAANAKLLESYYALIGMGPLFFTPILTRDMTSSDVRLPKISVACLSPDNRRGSISCIQNLFSTLNVKNIELEWGGNIIQGAVDGIELAEALTAKILQTAREPPANKYAALGYLDATHPTRLYQKKNLPSSRP